MFTAKIYQYFSASSTLYFPLFPKIMGLEIISTIFSMEYQHLSARSGHFHNVFIFEGIGVIQDTLMSLTCASLLQLCQGKYEFEKQLKIRY